MAKLKRKISNNIEDAWKEKYTLTQDFMGNWIVRSTAWRSNPKLAYKAISPWFAFRSEAEEWIKTRWKKHIDNKMERMLLGGK